MNEKQKIRIAWLSGGYHGRKAMSDAIRKKFKGHDLFEADSQTNPDYLIIQLQTIDVFSEKRLVVIKELPDFEDSNKKRRFLEKLKKALQTLDENIFVLFNGIDKDKEKALFTVFNGATNSKLYEYDEKLTNAEAPHWLRDRAKKYGYELAFDAATAVAELGGFDKALNGISADKLEMALQRMVLYSGTKKELGMEEATATMFEFENFVIWDLANALDAKDYDKCVEMSAKLHIADENIRSAVMQMMSTMLWRYRLMLFLKDRLSSTKSDPNSRNIVYNDAMSMRKLASQGSGLSARMSPELLKTGDNAGKPAPLWTAQSIGMYLDGMYGREPAINKYSRRDIYRSILAAQESLIILRSSYVSEEDAMLVAQLFFATVCNKLDDKDSRTIRQSMLEKY